MSLSALWSSVLWLLRALWACRVSVVSVLAGLALFGFVVQAQNLLADTSWSGNPFLAVAYWTLFFVAVFAIWAFPAHYGARRILDDQAWILSARMRATMGDEQAYLFCSRAAGDHETLILVLPRILGMLPFLAIALGLHFAHLSVEGAGGLQEGRQAIDLTFKLQVANAVTAAGFLLFLVCRKAIVRAMRRRLAQGRRGSLRAHPIDWLAILSTVCACLTFAIFVLAYFFPVWLSSYVSRALMVPFLLGCLVLPLSALVRLAHDHGKPYLLGLIALCVLATALNRDFHDIRTLASDPSSPIPRQMDIADAAEQWKLANGCGKGSDKPCPKALIVAAEGGASRAAFMTATAVGSVIDRGSELGDDPSLKSPGRRIFAISGVSGGAFGAAVIHAALADAAEAGGGDGPPCRNAPVTWFRAPAAVIHPEIVRSNWRYCLQALTSGDYLSASFVGTAFRDIFAPPLHRLWRPLGIEDRAALLEQSWDRHYDWVARRGGSSFSSGSPCNRIEGRGTGFCRRFGYSKELEQGGHWVPLLFLNGTSVATGRRVMVSEIPPMPVGNPTKDCRPLYPAAYDIFEAMGKATNPLDPATYEPPKNCRADVASPPAAPDIRLSTAALASARFPIISPAGRFHPADTSKYGDRVVDGGYFENAGLTTARDLVRALEPLGIRAVILWVANEPVLDSVHAVAGEPPAQSPPMGPSADASILVRAFGTLGAPIAALYATRDGHAAESAALADAAPGLLFRARVFGDAELDPDAKPNPADLQRCGELWQALKQAGKPLKMTKLSMSWWLSPAVQADLDAQLCDRHNLKEIGDLMTALSQRLP